MSRFWAHASYLLKVLAWRSLGYDEDGMELKFTSGSKKNNLEPKRNQEVSDFEKKMNAAKPNPNGEYVMTDMKANLALILEQHIKDNVNNQWTKGTRRLTILVLTDGLWEAMRNEEEVDNYLVEFIVNKIPDSHWELDKSTSTHLGQKSAPRPISIQFIRFGHHPKAIARLDRLDNELKNRPELAGKSIP